MSDYREMVEGKRQAMLDVLLQNIEQNPVKWQKDGTRWTCHTMARPGRIITD